MSSFAELRDPAAIRRARAELDAAEEHARADAAAAKRRATLDAEQAAEAAFQAEVDGLVAPVWQPVEAAQAAVQDLLGRQDVAETARRRAEWNLEAARAAIPRLVRRAVAGENITRDDVLAAYDEVTKAERYAGFLAVVASHFPALIAEAEAAVKAAIAVAHQPVYERGVDLRIEAAVLADEGRGITRDGNFNNALNKEAMDAAWKVFLYANRLLHYAAKRGVQIAAMDGITEQGPSRPKMERRRWKRPEPDGAT